MITGFWGYISAAVAIGITIFILGLGGAVLWALFNGTINLRYLLAEPADPVAQAAAQAADIAVDPAADAAVAPIPPLAPVAAPPETPKASMSRFQLLVFTFVIGGVYLVLCLESGTLVPIPDNVLLLLGISGGTYATAKGIKAASDIKSKTP